MDRVVVITLIICATLVLISIIRAVDSASSRKEVLKKLDKFGKAFDNKKKSDDDGPKFGGF